MKFTYIIGLCLLPWLLFGQQNRSDRDEITLMNVENSSAECSEGFNKISYEVGVTEKVDILKVYFDAKEHEHDVSQNTTGIIVTDHFEMPSQQVGTFQLIAEAMRSTGEVVGRRVVSVDITECCEANITSIVHSPCGKGDKYDLDVMMDDFLPLGTDFTVQLINASNTVIGDIPFETNSEGVYHIEGITSSDRTITVSVILDCLAEPLTSTYQEPDCPVCEINSVSAGQPLCSGSSYSIPISVSSNISPSTEVTIDILTVDGDILQTRTLPSQNNLSTTFQMGSSLSRNLTVRATTDCGNTTATTTFLEPNCCAIANIRLLEKECTDSKYELKFAVDHDLPANTLFYITLSDDNGQQIQRRSFSTNASEPYIIDNISAQNRDVTATVSADCTVDSPSIGFTEPICNEIISTFSNTFCTNDGFYRAVLYLDFAGASPYIGKITATGIPEQSINTNQSSATYEFLIPVTRNTVDFNVSLGTITNSTYTARQSMDVTANLPVCCGVRSVDMTTPICDGGKYNVGFNVEHALADDTEINIELIDSEGNRVKNRVFRAGDPQPYQFLGVTSYERNVTAKISVNCGDYYNELNYQEPFCNRVLQVTTHAECKDEDEYTGVIDITFNGTPPFQGYIITDFGEQLSYNTDNSNEQFAFTIPLTEEIANFDIILGTQNFDVNIEKPYQCDPTDPRNCAINQVVVDKQCQGDGRLSLTFIVHYGGDPAEIKLDLVSSQMTKTETTTATGSPQTLTIANLPKDGYFVGVDVTMGGGECATIATARTSYIGNGNCDNPPNDGTCAINSVWANGTCGLNEDYTAQVVVDVTADEVANRRVDIVLTQGATTVQRGVILETGQTTATTEFTGLPRTGETVNVTATLSATGCTSVTESTTFIAPTDESCSQTGGGGDPNDNCAIGVVGVEAVDCAADGSGNYTLEITVPYTGSGVGNMEIGVFPTFGNNFDNDRGKEEFGNNYQQEQPLSAGNPLVFTFADVPYQSDPLDIYLNLTDYGNGRCRVRESIKYNLPTECECRILDIVTEEVYEEAGLYTLVGTVYYDISGGDAQMKARLNNGEREVTKTISGATAANTSFATFVFAGLDCDGGTNEVTVELSQGTVCNGAVERAIQQFEPVYCLGEDEEDLGCERTICSSNGVIEPIPFGAAYEITSDDEILCPHINSMNICYEWESSTGIEDDLSGITINVTPNVTTYYTRRVISPCGDILAKEEFCVQVVDVSVQINPNVPFLLESEVPEDNRLTISRGSYTGDICWSYSKDGASFDEPICEENLTSYDLSQKENIHGTYQVEVTGQNDCTARDEIVIVDECDKRGIAQYLLSKGFVSMPVTYTGRLEGLISDNPKSSDNLIDKLGIPLQFEKLLSEIRVEDIFNSVPNTLVTGEERQWLSYTCEDFEIFKADYELTNDVLWAHLVTDGNGIGQLYVGGKTQSFSNEFHRWALDVVYRGWQSLAPKNEEFLSISFEVLNMETLANTQNLIPDWLEKMLRILGICEEDDEYVFDEKGGIIPKCFWEKSMISNGDLYTLVDSPFASGFIDAAYANVEGIVQLLNGVRNLKCAGLKLIPCHIIKMSSSRDELREFMEEVEEVQLTDRLKMAAGHTLNFLVNVLDPSCLRFTCEDARKTWNKVNDFIQFISEVFTEDGRLKEIYNDGIKLLKEYLKEVSVGDNEGRYERGRLVFDFAGLFASGGASIIDKLKKTGQFFKTIFSTKSSALFSKIEVNLADLTKEVKDLFSRQTITNLGEDISGADGESLLRYLTCTRIARNSSPNCNIRRRAEGYRMLDRNNRRELKKDPLNIDAALDLRDTPNLPSRLSGLSSTDIEDLIANIRSYLDGPKYHRICRKVEDLTRNLPSNVNNYDQYLGSKGFNNGSDYTKRHSDVQLDRLLDNSDFIKDSQTVNFENTIQTSFGNSDTDVQILSGDRIIEIETKAGSQFFDRLNAESNFNVQSANSIITATRIEDYKVFLRPDILAGLTNADKLRVVNSWRNTPGFLSDQRILDKFETYFGVDNLNNVQLENLLRTRNDWFDEIFKSDISL